MSARMRLMVAEDVEEQRTTFAQLLRDAGFEVLEAQDGLEALEIIQNPDELKLLVTNINMPGFSGFEVAEHARAAYPGIPVVFVTDRPEQVAEHGIGPPMVCVSKPVYSASLVEAVKRLLESEAG